MSMKSTRHHWFRRSIRQKSWTSDAPNKPQNYVLIGIDCFNWHIEIDDKPSSAPVLTGQVTDDAYDTINWISLHQVMACRLVGVKSLVDPLMTNRQF